MTRRVEYRTGPRDAGRFRAPAQLPVFRFSAEVTERGLVHLAHDRFPGAATPDELAALGHPVILRADASGEAQEAVIRLPGGVLALVDVDYGHVRIEVAGAGRSELRAAIGRVRERLAVAAPARTSVRFSFWSRGRAGGGSVRTKLIDVPAWDEIRPNYPEAIQAALERLYGLTEPGSGRLLVWRGPPGTGKTWALRALARAWKEWASMHYVLDPEALFGADPHYLLDILTHEGHDEDDDEQRWRLLVLEDAGELVVRDAGGGSALAPLLNVTDGLLGQGTRTLVLITTNEPVGRLHPAVRRPGRCLCDLEFGPLSRAEAGAWLAGHGSDHEPPGPMTLGECFARASARDADEALAPVPARTPFGFARAMEGVPGA